MFLQIKSLLGHRSQAAPEVRLVSGRHLKDFCEFLQSQCEHFVVEGDRVRLKNMPEPSDGVELDDEGRPLAGVKAKQAAVDYLRSVVEQVGLGAN
jgi:exonuclease 3'-5' domain-containing protein 1